MKPQLRFSLVAILALILLPGHLLAAGFGIYEQSAKASGLAGAWVARADDAAANWYNPAALIWLEGSEFQFGTNIINTGDSELTSNDASFGLFQPTTFEQESNLATPSHLYYRTKLNNNIAFGIGLTTPFGLVTEWAERPVTFSAAKSELVTFVINPNVAVRLTESWSLAVGIDYLIADLKNFSREVPIDLDRNPLNGFEVVGFSNLTGDGDEFGWNVALHHKRGNFTFGASYRSDMTVGIDGDIEFSNFGPLAAFFQSSPGTADLELPETLAIGFGWQGPRWAFEADVVQVGWSVFDVLRVDITNNVPGFVEDIALLEDWDDSNSYRFGLSRKMGQKGELRFGLNIEEGAVPEHTLRPSIPDSDRTAPSIGYGWDGSKWAVDAYAQTFIFDDITAVAGEEGVIVADYDSGVTLLGFTFGRKF